ncbi:fumarylacetoacetate hydrolase family protein [Bradyrhizobium cytisi]|uniref:fumarylacetoacetate hydrolase family protein n=1 Tax=Bradyrhizobium cytisi TaxID=515489 RepID=UPI003D323995
MIPNPSRILCAGLNYLSHLNESRQPRPQRPIIFTRFASSQVGHLDSLVRPKLSENFDFEGELALIIGKPCRYVSRDRDCRAILDRVGWDTYIPTSLEKDGGSTHTRAILKWTRCSKGKPRCSTRANEMNCSSVSPL